MRKILSIALNELRISFADRSIWLFLVVIPGLLIFLIGLANGANLGGGGSGEAPKRLVDVIDQDDSALSAQLLLDLRTIDSAIVICPADNDAEDICRLNGDDLTAEKVEQRLNDSVSTALIEIPAGFGEALLGGQPNNLIYRSDEDISVASPNLAALQAAVQRISGATAARQFAASLASADESLDGNAEFADNVYQRAAELWGANLLSMNAVEAQDIETGASSQPGFQQSVPGMGSMYVMFTVLGGTVILIQERKQWTLQRITTMPVSRGQFIAGKMLARVTMGMIQFAVAFGVGLVVGLVFDVSYGNSPIALLLLMLSFSLCISAIALLIATLVSNEQQAAGFTTLLALTLAPIGGAWWSLEFEFIPQFMKDIAVISPIYWVMDGFNAVILHEGGIVEVLPAVGVLLAISAVVFVIAISRFRVVE